MSESEEEAAEGLSWPPYTKAERMQQLEDVDKSIVQLLKTVGGALEIFTTSGSDEQTFEERKKSFEDITTTFLNSLHKVDVDLRRHIWGLEEADILPGARTKKAAAPTNAGPGADGQPNFAGQGAKRAVAGDNSRVARNEELAVEGGMGNLDIGFLNSRSGRVGRDMESELWAKASFFMEELEKGKHEGRKIPEREESNKG